MLKNAGNYLQNNPFGLAVVAAYTDMKGDTEKDRLLSEHAQWWSAIIW